MSARSLAVGVLVLAGLAMAGCGGEGPSAADLDTVEAILSSSADVDRVMQPLYLCVPGDAACYKRSGPQAVETVQRERRSIAPTLAATENSCLAEVGRLFGKSLVGYADAGRAATRGNSSAFDAALSRTTRHEIAYVRKLGQCGFTEGRLAEIGAALREVNVAMLRLNEEIVQCETTPCVNRVAREMERQASVGVARLDDFLGELDDDAPGCLREGLLEMRKTFLTVRRAAVALRKGRFAIAEKEGTRSIEQGASAKQLLATCLASVRS